MREVEKWGMLELEFAGKADGNPFRDDQLSAEFTDGEESLRVDGFYDGDGIYKVRFMPVREGVWKYRVFGNCLEQEETGEFLTVPVADPGKNHGPVQVVKERYLAYADGSPYHSIGTTCYAWVNQAEDLQELTLRTLEKSCFNKIRFCIFPKFYRFNEKEPVTYPYVRGKAAGLDAERMKRVNHVTFHTSGEVSWIQDFDCYTFNTEHFKRFDERIMQLRELGIEADIILFHPYDKWGFSAMERECNEQYLRYMAARYGAYRNVWWSMANEYDLFGWPAQEWEDYARFLRSRDPWHHLCSIHNCVSFYDYTQDWVTHCSMQRTDLYKHVEETDAYLESYHKPVVWDEIAYEGNIDLGWGNISGQELVRRFWESVLRGGCAGHGETYVHPQDILWWSHGGKLHGDSEPRLAFLLKIWDEVPGGYLQRGGGIFDETVAVPLGEEKRVNWEEQQYVSFEIHYYGFGRPSYREFDLPENERYQVDVIDTWNMTVTDAGIHSGFTRIPLPGREYMAVRLRRV